MKKVYVVLLLFPFGVQLAYCIPISSSNSFSSNSVDFEDALINLSIAESICAEKLKLIPMPNEQELAKMIEISNDKLFTYIGYRSIINNDSCLVSNGAPPKEYFIAITYDMDLPYYTRRQSEELLKLITSTRIIESYHNLNSKLTEEDIAYLDEIKYLQSDFDLVELSNSIYNHQDILLQE